jgi:3-oxoacyl-[acyl-carrier-protein] synthase III
VIANTLTPDFNNPGLASCLVDRLGLVGVPIFELAQPNSGFGYTAELAKALIQTGKAHSVLVVLVDMLSRFFEEQLVGSPSNGARRAFERFGDGAAVFIMQQDNGASNSTKSLTNVKHFSLRSSVQRTLPRDEKTLYCWLPAANRFPSRITVADVEAGLHYPEINPEEFQLAQEIFAKDFDRALSSAGISRATVISHQIFSGMNKQLAQALSIAPSAIIDLPPKYGFVGSAGGLMALTSDDSEEAYAVVELSSGASWSITILERL